MKSKPFELIKFAMFSPMDILNINKIKGIVILMACYKIVQCCEERVIS